jgi:sirohydrochlorin ferrochelatase
MALVLAFHGTRSPAGRATYMTLADRVAELVPEVPVRLGYLDVQEPVLSDVARPGDVVVPVLLARGYHVRVDCAAVAAPGVVVADAVGPDRALVTLAQHRLTEAGAGPDWPVVLVAAGSRDPAALADLDQAAAALATRRGTRVRVAMASRAGSVEAAVAELRAEQDRPIAAASWLIAPGVFASVAERCGADVVSRPLGACPTFAGVVVARYRAALQAMAA